MRAHLLLGSIVVFSFMTAVWILSVVRRNASFVDRAWGLAFVLLGWTYIVTTHDPSPRALLAATLVTVWGLRLSAFMMWREWGEGEDWRHTRMREQARVSFALRSLILLFLMQGAAVIGVATPLLAVVGFEKTLNWLDGVGVLVWAGGFLVEVIADMQLARFRAAGEKGALFDGGLWRYTRHPNYFGDAVQWWGLGLIGLAAGAWWSIIGPAAMTIVLLRVSGVTVMEEHMRETRGPLHVDYVRRTSAFVPWPQRAKRHIP